MDTLALTSPVSISRRPYVHRAPAPMLARDADAMYWMARYVERAEHVARLLSVHGNLLADVADLSGELRDRHWNSIPDIMGVAAPDEGDEMAGRRVSLYMTFDESNSNSIVSCVTRARENARSIRENISNSMWEELNTLYWSIRAEDAAARFEESADNVYRMVSAGSMLFQGLTDQTLRHDQGWLFTQLAKYMERIDFTCRTLRAKFDILNDASAAMELPVRNIHWMAVLRSCSSIEAFRRQNLFNIGPMNVASFLILEADFPRSIRFSVRMAHEAAAAIRAEVNPRAIDPAERILGRLDAQLEYAELAEIESTGLLPYLARIQDDVAQAAMQIQRIYFLH